MPRSVSAPPTPSSTTSTTSDAVRAADVDAHRRRAGVLADVGEALRDDVVGGHLDLLGEAVFERHGRAAPGVGRLRGDRLERHVEPVPAQHRRMQAARHRAQLVERDRDLAPRAARAASPPRGRPRAASRAGSARATARSGAAGHRRGGCAPAAAAPSGPPRSPARASPSAPPDAPAARPAAARSRARSRPRRRPRRAARARPRAPGHAGARPCARRRGRSASSPCRSRSRAAPRAGRRDRPSSRTRAASTRASDGSRSARASAFSEPCRRRIRTQLDEQVSYARAGEPRVEEPDQERERRDPDHDAASPAGSPGTPGPSKAPKANSTAIITRPRANESISSADRSAQRPARVAPPDSQEHRCPPRRAR